MRPVRRYVSEYLHLMLLGARPRHMAGAIVEFARVSGEQPVNMFFESGLGRDKLELDDLVQAVYDDKVASGALNQARIAKSSVLAKNLGNMVSRWELAQQLEKGVKVLSATQQVNVLQHAGVQWYHEEYLPRDRDTKLVEPVR